MTNDFPPTAAAVDWKARHEAVVAAEGDEWERLSEAFDRDWKGAYKAEFVRFAVSRHWDLEDASVWSEEIAGEALLSQAAQDDYRPETTAQRDVLECELEAANAP